MNYWFVCIADLRMLLVNYWFVCIADLRMLYVNYWFVCIADLRMLLVNCWVADIVMINTCYHYATEFNRNIKVTLFKKYWCNRAFNIFQVYQYFTLYRGYFLFKFEQFSWISYTTPFKIRTGGTKDHFRQVKEPGTAPLYTERPVQSIDCIFIDWIKYILISP